jgi:chromosome segregation ATPase
MKGSSDSDHLVTPCQKQMLLKSGLKPLNMDFPPTSNGENSHVSSVKETCESPLSSWDSEPETDISFVVNYGDAISEGSLEGINLEEKYLEMEQENQFVGVENTDDGLLWQMDNRSYDELLKKFIENEEELRVSNFKLQLSEQEIIKLKIQIDERENQLGNVREELKLKEEKLAKLECQVFSGRNHIEMLEHLVKKYKAIKTIHEYRVQKLNSEMLDLKAKFSLKKDEIHYDIASLSEMNLQLISKLEKCESRNNELENKLRQYEAEKLKQEELHATQQMVLQDEISSLREELCRRKHDVEAANKEFDKLMIEKDEANTKIDKLNAEIFSNNDQISDFKRYIHELEIRLTKQLEVNYKLKLKVGELEQEVTRQNGVISDRAEGKYGVIA